MKKRVISAVIALLISLPLVYIGGVPFYILAIIIALLAFKEMLDLITNDYWIRLVSYINFLFLIGNSIIQKNFSSILDFKVLGIILLIFGLLLLFNHKNKKFNVEKCFYLIGITLFLGTAFATLIILRNMNLYYFIYVFLITIMNDTFAHSVGTLFGKHKINEISPNKSWEGCIAGLLGGIIFFVGFSAILRNIGITDLNLLIMGIIGCVVSIISQIGDFSASSIKRYCEIKDFSNIMPGHGGMLDRFDSILFVAPIVYSALAMMI